jgi:hypothetical protein
MDNMVVLLVEDNPSDIDLTLHASVYAGWC